MYSHFLSKSCQLTSLVHFLISLKWILSKTQCIRHNQINSCHLRGMFLTPGRSFLLAFLQWKQMWTPCWFDRKLKILTLRLGNDLGRERLCLLGCRCSSGFQRFYFGRFYGIIGTDKFFRSFEMPWWLCVRLDSLKSFLDSLKVQLVSRLPQILRFIMFGNVCFDLKEL